MRFFKRNNISSGKLNILLGTTQNDDLGLKNFNENESMKVGYYWLTFAIVLLGILTKFLFF